MLPYVGSGRTVRGCRIVASSIAIGGLTGEYSWLRQVISSLN
jgi:hypothetical protein